MNIGNYMYVPLNYVHISVVWPARQKVLVRMRKCMRTEWYKVQQQIFFDKKKKDTKKLGQPSMRLVGSQKKPM